MSKLENKKILINVEKFIETYCIRLENFTNNKLRYPETEMELCILLLHSFSEYENSSLNKTTK